MIDPRIGKRIKEARKRLGLTQEQFAEKAGFTANYISMLERGKSFPRCDRLIILLNNLEVPADAIFCDVVIHTHQYRENQLSEQLDDLPPEVSDRILQLLELLIQLEL
ncbi:MAG: helix-turn-helix transcriptional regulator [Subdoligranulum sp.]|nr:helix-turn-helix transcriptional regulator [Subdoligranulum sp.]